jgi:transposase-like protein
MAVSFKGAHFPQEIILTCIRWYVAYPLSTRHVEELMRERGVPVDHATVICGSIRAAGSRGALRHKWRPETAQNTHG